MEPGLYIIEENRVDLTVSLLESYYNNLFNFVIEYVVHNKPPVQEKQSLAISYVIKTEYDLETTIKEINDTLLDVFCRVNNIKKTQLSEISKDVKNNNLENCLLKHKEFLSAWLKNARKNIRIKNAQLTPPDSSILKVDYEMNYPLDNYEELYAKTMQLHLKNEQASFQINLDELKSPKEGVSNLLKLAEDQNAIIPIDVELDFRNQLQRIDKSRKKRRRAKKLKKWGLGFLLLILLAGGWYMYKTYQIKKEIAFWEMSRAGKKYQEYLEEYPEGKYSNDAHQRIDKDFWLNAVAMDTDYYYLEYLEGGKKRQLFYKEEALEKLETKGMPLDNCCDQLLNLVLKGNTKQYHNRMINLKFDELNTTKKMSTFYASIYDNAQDIRDGKEVVSGTINLQNGSIQFGHNETYSFPKGKIYQKKGKIFIESIVPGEYYKLD